MTHRTQAEHIALLAMVDRPYGDIAQSLFKYEVSDRLWSHTVPEAIRIATASVNKTHPNFRPGYDHRLDDIL